MPDAPRKKMLLSTLMTLLVCLMWLCRANPRAWWALAAIFCSWTADGLLAKYPPFLARVRGGFFVGAALFALAHVCYAGASVMILRAAGVPLRWSSFAALMGLFACAVCAHALLFARTSRRAAGFTAAACCYLLVVGAMAALTIRVAAASGGRLWMLPLGACLFFLSDCILVVREYRREKSRVLSTAVWATYLSAQALLQLGLWLS